MRLLADTIDYGYGTVGLGVVANRGWVARNEDLARRVVQAAAEGVAFALQNKERTIQVVAEYVQSTDMNLLERSYNDAAANWPVLIAQRTRYWISVFGTPALTP